MSTYGELDAGVVITAIIAEQAFIDTLPSPSDWIVLPYGVGVDWEWSGSVWTGPDGESPPTEPAMPGNYLLTGPEWVERFTEVEWKWLKGKRVENNTAGERLDQMMDSIRWLNAVNVGVGGPIDEFYTWLLDQGIPGGQTRIDELRVPAS
jgi:hypothetical protein